MFEGKEVEYITRGGTSMGGVVVACVKDIGITVVNKDDPNQILLCLVGHAAPNFIPAKGKIMGSKKSFISIRKQIISGVIDRRKTGSTKNTLGFIPHNLCPFSQ